MEVAAARVDQTESERSLYPLMIVLVGLIGVVWAIGWTQEDGSRRHRRAGVDVDDNLADPDRIAETYLQLHRQHRSTWAFEVVARQRPAVNAPKNRYSGMDAAKPQPTARPNPNVSAARRDGRLMARKSAASKRYWALISASPWQVGRLLPPSWEDCGTCSQLDTESWRVLGSRGIVGSVYLPFVVDGLQKLTERRSTRIPSARAPFLEDCPSEAI